MEKTVNIDEPETRARFGFGEALRNERRAQKISDTGTGRSGSEHDNVLIAKPTARHADRGEDRANGNRGRALNVVVESNELIPGAIQDGARVGVGEVFPL